MRNLDEIRAAKRKGEPLTKTETQALSRYWRSGVAAPENGGKRTINALNYGGEVLEDPRKHEAGLVCTFCRAHVNNAEATIGTTTMVFSQLVSLRPFVETKFVRSLRAIACPQDAHKIVKVDDRQWRKS